MTSVKSILKMIPSIILLMVIMLLFLPFSTVKADPPRITISGTITYIDRYLDLIGADRFLVALLTTEATPTVLDTVFTNSTGGYSFATIDNPGQDLKVFIYPKYSVLGRYSNAVTPPTGASVNEFYSNKTISLDGSESGTVPGDWSITSFYKNPFWVKDALQLGCDKIPTYPTVFYLTAQYDRDGEMTADPDWQFSNYSTIYNIMRIQQEDITYSPDTVLHEMSHAVMYNTYGYMPPIDYGMDGTHYMWSDETQGTAWVE